MKKYKCPNCARESEVKKDIVMVVCPCGYNMSERKMKNHNHNLGGCL